MVYTKLNRFSFKARKWREDNGFTTPEWRMYAENSYCTLIFFSILTGVLASFIGVIVGPAYIASLQYEPYVATASLINDLGFLLWDMVRSTFDLFGAIALLYLGGMSMIGLIKWIHSDSDEDNSIRCMIHNSLWWHKVLMKKVKGD